MIMMIYINGAEALLVSPVCVMVDSGVMMDNRSRDISRF
jgi:hypothetical protein